MGMTTGSPRSAGASAVTWPKKMGESPVWQSVHPPDPSDRPFGRTSWPMGHATGAAAGLSDGAMSCPWRRHILPAAT